MWHEHLERLLRKEKVQHHGLRGSNIQRQQQGTIDRTQYITCPCLI